MKKFLSIILAILIFCMIPVSSYAETEEKGTPLTKQLFKFMQDGSYQNMYIDSNYGYENFLNDFESNPLSQYFFHMADLLIETGTEPSEKKYRDVLIGLMGSYDLENAADLGKQNRQDHLKSLEDYGKDAMDIMKDAASLTIAKYPNLSEMDSFFFTAIEGIYTMKDNVENLITTFSDLETVLQNYSLYDSFLKTVEEHAGDHTDLKNAASSLRNSMAKVMEYRMTAYREASNENFENWGKYFFSDAFFTAVKQIPEYTSDDTMRFFVDGAENFIGKVNILKDSWNLGVKIGTLVGNLTVGGENLIDRVLEMMAVQNIADSLKNGWDEQWNEFGDLIGTENETSAANQLISYMKYLGLCRIRGEYCLYSILEKDAGLLSWFNKKTQKQAQEWYNTQSGIVSDILAILKNAEEQAKKEEDKKNIFTPEHVENLYLDFLKSGKYESDSSDWINPASQYCIFDINDDGISELLVMGDEMSFQHCLIYTLNINNEEITLINDTYYYASLRYSPAHKAIVYTYPRPMAGASESYFDVMDGTSFKNIITLEIEGEDHYSNNKIISKTEYQQYFSELIYFEFIDIPNQNVSENIFETLAGKQFVFTSGMGSWSTCFDLNLNGTFEGEHTDIDMGITGEQYPNGTRYICKFDGKFTNLEKIDEYTYSIKLEYLDIQGKEGEEYYEDGYRYIYVEPLGLAKAEEFFIYCPGKPIADLPEMFIRCVSPIMIGIKEMETFPNYAIYSVVDKASFICYDN